MKDRDQTGSGPTRTFDAFVGVDGCKAGWLAVALAGGTLHHLVARRIDEVSAAFPSALILVDVPVGLRNTGRAERLCDLAARTLLGPRRSSVFPAPARAALEALDYPTACAANLAATAGARKLSKQSWAIVPKIREVDAYLRRRNGDGATIREMHPEVCFWSLNGSQPLRHGKKSAEGYAERVALLRRHVAGIANFIARMMSTYRRSDVGRDDVVDAIVGTVTAFVGREGLRTVPDQPERDAFGLPMEMVYATAAEDSATPRASL